MLTITSDFLIDNKPFKLISGSIHYFRILPEYWQDRLEKLKNMGCNTVETYIPWNFHEPKKGQFRFEGRYWNIGPQTSLYIPAPLLHKGKNEIIMFEEKKTDTKIRLLENHNWK